MSDRDHTLAQLPETLRKLLDPATPAAQRMMAAKGIVPAPPPQLVTVVALLAGDADPTLASAAAVTLGKLPPGVLQAAVSAGLAPEILAAAAEANADNPASLEPLLLARDLPDETMEALAGRVPEAAAELIANNQERHLRRPGIAIALAANQRCLRSTIDRVFDFLVRAGLVLDVPEFVEAVQRLSPSEALAASDKMELPPEIAAAGLLTERDEGQPGQPAAGAEEPAGAQDGAPPDQAAADEERVRLPTLKLINSLNTAQKIALALKGNKEARGALIRDTNRLVAAAAIRSPRITEQEVVSAAQSRSASDEVIRIIAGSREMTRSYGVKVALCANPKTPLATALKLLQHLRRNDLRALARNKNVPSGLTGAAKRLAEQRSA